MPSDSNTSNDKRGRVLEEGLPEHTAEPMPQAEAAPSGTTRRTKMTVAAVAGLILAAAGSLVPATMHGCIRTPTTRRSDGHIMPLSAG